MMEAYPQIENLVFREQDHSYVLNGCIRLDSVTQIMKPLSDAVYHTVDPEVLANAAQRGTAVHNAIELYLSDGIEDVSPERQGFFDAFKAWQRDMGAVIIAAEMPIYHKVLLYAGKFDMLARIAGKVHLVDVKTTADVLDDLVRVQLEAYDQAAETHGIKTDGKMALHLRADGRYTPHEFLKNDREAWRVMSDLLGVNRYISKYLRR